LSIYFISGIKKIKNIRSLATGLKSKVYVKDIDLPLNLYKFIIMLVILLEIFAPIIITYSFAFNKQKDFAQSNITYLIIFSIIATMLYHPPNVKKQFTTFLKNISIIGGLMLLKNSPFLQNSDLLKN
jgi:hypothetical protein